MHAASSMCCCLHVDTASLVVSAEMNVKHDTALRPFASPCLEPLGSGTPCAGVDNRVVDRCFAPRYPFLATLLMFLGATLRKACFAGYFCHVKTSTLDFTPPCGSSLGRNYNFFSS